MSPEKPSRKLLTNTERLLLLTASLKPLKDTFVLKLPILLRLLLKPSIRNHKKSLVRSQLSLCLAKKKKRLTGMEYTSLTTPTRKEEKVEEVEEAAEAEEEERERDSKLYNNI